jgi:hypothetical protein
MPSPPDSGFFLDVFEELAKNGNNPIVRNPFSLLGNTYRIDRYPDHFNQDSMKAFSNNPQGATIAGAIQPVGQARHPRRSSFQRVGTEAGAAIKSRQP